MALGKRKRSSSRGAYRRRSLRSFRKRVSRRSYYRSKRGRMVSSYKFHRWVTVLNGVNILNCTYDANSIITATAANPTVSFSIKFTLDDLPNYADFTGLFDSYMITGVMLQIKMIDNPNSGGPANVDAASATTYYNNTNNFYPTLWYVPDHDDGNTISLSAIKEFERVRHKVLLPNKETNIMLRPTTLTQVFRTTTTSGYVENQKRQWIDLAQVDVPHYGLKCVIDFEGLTPERAYTFKVNAKYYFRCKNVR